jgi:hypothetical protein
MKIIGVLAILPIVACGSGSGATSGDDGGTTTTKTDGGTTSDVATGTDTGGCADDDSPPDVAPTFQTHFAIVNQVLTARDITPAGGTALLLDLATADFYFYDTATDKLTLEGSSGNPAQDFATGISGSRHVVSANYGQPVQAGLWNAKDGWLALPSPYPDGCQGDVGAAWDVSADGKVAVGMMWNGCTAAPFRWDQTACMQGKTTALEVLGMPPEGAKGGPNNRVTKVSDDGKIGGGFAQYGGAQDRWPARWDASGKGQLLEPLPASTFDVNTAPGEVSSISANGDVLAGTGCGMGDTMLGGWVWNATDASPQRVSLGMIPGITQTMNTQVFPTAMNAQGTIIFGAVDDGGLRTAFVWTLANGMRKLQDVATKNGISIPGGYGLAQVLGASSDGTVLVGDGSDGRPFVMVLPTSAY